MARVNGVSYSQVVLAFDLDDTGTYSQFCTINGDKALTLSNTYVESSLPDCADPNLPDIPEHTPDTRSATFNGGGKLHADDLSKFGTDIHLTGRKVKCKASAGKAGAGITITGFVVFENFEFNSARKQYADGSVSGMFTGEYVIADIPA